MRISLLVFFACFFHFSHAMHRATSRVARAACTVAASRVRPAVVNVPRALFAERPKRSPERERIVREAREQLESLRTEFKPMGKKPITDEEKQLRGAVCQSDYALAKRLLTSGVDANLIEGKNNDPLLMLADKKMMEILLQNGANANARDKSGTTAFMKAVEDNDGEKVNTLIKAHANPFLQKPFELIVEYGWAHSNPGKPHPPLCAMKAKTVHYNTDLEKQLIEYAEWYRETFGETDED